MPRADKKAQLIEVAIEHFNKNGFHATGIDLILAESGIAKTTLYRHFPSKEALIVAALRVIDARYRNAMRTAVDAVADPREKILATFDYLERWFAGATFYGCPFMSAASEFGDADDPVFREAALHKRLMLAYLEELVTHAGYPPETAARINLLHEGATAVAHVTGQPDAAALAREVAAELLPVTPNPAGR
jgi:AcrR family transcriptional regulator